MPKALPRTEVRAKGQVTIPAEVREQAHLEEGDLMEVEVVDEGILLRPQKVVDTTQAWFWTSTWQGKMRRAEEDLETGRVAGFDSGEEFIKTLRLIHEQGDSSADL